VKRIICTLLLTTLVVSASDKDKAKKKGYFATKSALDEYIEQAHKRAAGSNVDNPGSLFNGGPSLGDLAIDLRARSVDDIVTILVNEQANAVSTGATKTGRTSSANASLSSGAIKSPAATGLLGNILTTNGSTSLNGTGTTSRQTTLSTTLTARITDVLPNGNLVVEGTKSVLVNSENQVVTVRGVVRPTDLSNSNVVQSDNIAEMELKINGKGVVNDSIHRPNFLYRLLLGVLPF
jgi:flagellar L-ring protein precursor FlgH